MDIYSGAKLALCSDTGEACVKVVQTKGVSLKGALRLFFGSTLPFVRPQGREGTIINSFH
jgi:hypothetical protein